MTLTLMGSAFDDPNQRFPARQLFNLLGDAIDEGNVSYGKFQIEVTVPQLSLIHISEPTRPY